MAVAGQRRFAWMREIDFGAREGGDNAHSMSFDVFLLSVLGAAGALETMLSVAAEPEPEPNQVGGGAGRHQPHSIPCV